MLFHETKKEQEVCQTMGMDDVVLRPSGYWDQEKSWTMLYSPNFKLWDLYTG